MRRRQAVVVASKVFLLVELEKFFIREVEKPKMEIPNNLLEK